MVKDRRAYSAPAGFPASEAKSSEHDRAKLKHDVATFKMLCQGRDGKLCLFEDADGHFTVVRADRLA